jgi:cbb3-type cytochrome oxidase maturation protein
LRKAAAMEILVLLIPVSVLLVLLIGAVFWWSVRSGQFDDLDGPAHRILADDDTSDAIPGKLPERDSRIEPAGALTSINPAPE